MTPGVAVGLALGLAVAVGVGEALTVAVGVADGLAVGEAVAVAVGVAVGVGVAVAVAVGVGVSESATGQKPLWTVKEPPDDPPVAVCPIVPSICDALAELEPPPAATTDCVICSFPV